MWGFALAGFTMPQGWGSDWHANPLHIPHLAPTGAQSKQRKLCYMSAFCCLLKNTNVSNAPPLGQQTADKSPHNPLPYPVLGVVGRDNDRHITLPSFSNALSFASCGFYGGSTTLSALLTIRAVFSSFLGYKMVNP